MWLLVVSCLTFLITNLSTATIPNQPLSNFYSKNPCQNIGDKCQENNNCCQNLICYSIQNEKRCLSSDKRIKRYADEFIVPPYYNPNNYLYPYGINMPPFPFYNAYGAKQSKIHHRNKMEWDHCQFHEDCGEGNCCYVHFRFRSLPKSFCRPNRNINSELCEPLTRYRSLKDVPAWKQQKQQIHDEQQQQQQQKQQLVSLRTTYFGR